MCITHPLVGALSAALFPQKQQPCHHLAPLTTVVDPIAFDSAAVAIGWHQQRQQRWSVLWCPPPSHCCVPPSFTTTCKLRHGVHRSLSQVHHDGHSCGQVAPPAIQVGKAPVIHVAGAGQDLAWHPQRPPTQPPGIAACAACHATTITLTQTWAHWLSPPCTTPGVSGGGTSQGRGITPPWQGPCRRPRQSPRRRRQWAVRHQRRHLHQGIWGTGRPRLTTTLAVCPDQPAEQLAPRRPATRAPAGVDPCAPPTIAAAVTHVIPVLAKAAAASFVILIVVFINNDKNIHWLTKILSSQKFEDRPSSRVTDEKG